MAATNNKRKKTSEERPQSLENEPFYGLVLDDEQKAFRDAIWSPEKLIVFVDAPAGTGKSTIALGVANLLCHYGDYDGISWIMTPVQEQRQGFLPGTIAQKSHPYFQSLYDAAITCNLNPFVCIETPDDLTNVKDETAFIQCYTDTFMRGANVSRRCVILDECQNYTIEGMRKVLTRIKDDCKCICIGHSGQIDLQNKRDSGFAKYIEHFRKSEDSRVAICNLITNYRGWLSNWADQIEV